MVKLRGGGKSRLAAVLCAAAGTAACLLPCSAGMAAERPEAAAYKWRLRDIDSNLPFLELSFDHPPFLSLRVEAERVIKMPGHAGLLLSSVLVGRGRRADDTLMLVTFFDLALLEEFRGAAADPEGFVRKAAQAQRESPYLGVVGPAASPGPVEHFKGEGFEAAEIEFQASQSKAGPAYSGRLIEILFPGFRVEARVQMVGRDPALLRQVRDAISRSFKLRPSPAAADAPQAGSAHLCRSDRDCWCRVFTGARFIAGKGTGYCDLPTGRCQPCTYE